MEAFKQLNMKRMFYIIPYSIIIKKPTDKTGIATHLPIKLEAGHSKPNLPHVFI